MKYIFDNRNLEAEIKRNCIKKEEIAIVLDISISTLYARLKGKTDWQFNECLKIKDTFFPNLEIDYLFTYRPIEQTA